jgi:hypothetical protein
MSQESEFPFDRARRATPEAHQQFKAAIAQQFETECCNAGRFRQGLGCAEFDLGDRLDLIDSGL